MNGSTEGRRRGAVLVLVLAVVGVLAILGIALLASSQEGYNQAAVAVVGQRADMLARSCLDEARDALVGWMARWPGRVPAGATLDPSTELHARVQRAAASGALPGEAWSEPLTAFGGVSLIAQSADAAAREGFAIDEPKVRFHGFHRVRTTPPGFPDPLKYYGLAGDEGPAVNEYKGFATFEATARSERGRAALKRTIAVTYDVVIADMIPWAGRFALFAQDETPGAREMGLDQNPLPAESARTTAGWTDLNRGGSLRVFPRGARVFVTGPYVVNSTGSPNGNAPDTRFSLAGDFGPGLATDQHWRDDTWLGWGATPAPRAGIVKPTDSFAGLVASIAPNARPRDTFAFWNAIFPDPSRLEDPGVQMPRPQMWFAEHQARIGPDGADRGRRGFSIVGDPQAGAFSPYTGRLVRLPDAAGEDAEDLGLVEPDLDATADRAWKHPRLDAEHAALDQTSTGAFAENRDLLIAYAKRRFAVLPEGRLFALHRWGRFETPVPIVIAKVAYPAIVAAGLVVAGPIGAILVGGAASPLALLATFDGYQVGRVCQSTRQPPQLPDDNTDPVKAAEQWLNAAAFSVTEWQELTGCQNGATNSATGMPDEALHLFGAHWQPLVIPDPREDFFKTLVIGIASVMTFGWFTALLVVPGAVQFALTAVVAGGAIAEMATASPGPPSGAAAFDPKVTVAPYFRDVRGLVLRVHETLDDALQDDGQGGKVLLLNGVVRVRKLVGTVPFRYAGRGLVYSDDAGEPVLTGPIVPVDFDPAGGETLTHHLTIVHWRDGVAASEVARGQRAVRLSGAAGATPFQAFLEDTAPTSALFRVTLVAQEGARPDDGGSARAPTARAIVLGNLVVGLPNKAGIPDAAELAVVHEKALATPLTHAVAGIGGRAVEVHR